MRELAELSKHINRSKRDRARFDAFLANKEIKAPEFDEEALEGIPDGVKKAMDEQVEKQWKAMNAGQK